MSYESDSPADRLAAVRASIAKVLNSQEYEDGDIRNRYAQLKELRAMEKDLQNEVNQASSGITLGQMTTFPP